MKKFQNRIIAEIQYYGETQLAALEADDFRLEEESTKVLGPITQIGKSLIPEGYAHKAWEVSTEDGQYYLFSDCFAVEVHLNLESA